MADQLIAADCTHCGAPWRVCIDEPLTCCASCEHLDTPIIGHWKP